LLSGWGSNLSLGASAYQRIISNNCYAHDEQGDNPGQEKESSTIAVKTLATLAWLKQLDLAGRWLEQYTAPVRAKPDSFLSTVQSFQ